MALKPVYFLLLWGLTLLTHGVTSMCNITCSTDYKALLNCSCSGSVLTHPVLLQVNCSGEDEDVEGSCEVKPPQSWCIIYQEDLDDVASIGTMCSGKAIQQDNGLIISQPSSWVLSEVVKPQPPFNVQVTHADTFNKITWDNLNPRDCLTYNIRIRDSKDLSKDPFLSIFVEKNETEIYHENLLPRVKYTVNIRAKMCPGNLYNGPWSEWSSTNTIEGHVGVDQKPLWPLCFIIFLVLGIAFWFCFQKFHWREKLQLITYIPKPDEFFKPLYHNYGGNFKEWVKPVFSEYDYLMINSQIQTTAKKPHDILQWNDEKQCYSEILETKKVGQFLQTLKPQSNLPLYFQDGGSSQGTSHSVGHISIHTVTLSGEEFEEEVMSQNSMNTLKSYQDGESFGSFEEDNREHASYDLGGPQLSMLDRQNGLLPQHENQISNELSLENLNFQPHAQIHEPERLSLDSFASNYSNDSNDGYPHVDLDTIDSGFVECSSPGASDSNRGDHIDLFNEHKNSNSNYVKQWMVCNTIQEDSSSPENELHETQ